MVTPNKLSVHLALQVDGVTIQEPGQARECHKSDIWGLNEDVMLPQCTCQ